MKQLSVIIEHRKFALNVQDEYYEKLLILLNQSIDLSDNNSLSQVLSLCIKSSIELIDIEDSTRDNIGKIDKITSKESADEHI